MRRACVLAPAAAARLGGRAGDSKRVGRACVLHACGCLPARTRCSCAGPPPCRRGCAWPCASPERSTPGHPGAPGAASCGGAAGVTRGDSGLATGCSRLYEFGAPSPLKKRLNPFKGKQHTKYSSNQILLSSGLGLHSGFSIWGLLSVSARQSPSCSREYADLPSPSSPLACRGLFRRSRFRRRSAPHVLRAESVASGGWHLMPAVLGLATRGPDVVRPRSLVALVSAPGS